MNKNIYDLNLIDVIIIPNQRTKIVLKCPNITYNSP